MVINHVFTSIHYRQTSENLCLPPIEIEKSMDWKGNIAPSLCSLFHSFHLFISFYLLCDRCFIFTLYFYFHLYLHQATISAVWSRTIAGIYRLLLVSFGTQMRLVVHEYTWLLCMYIILYISAGTYIIITMLYFQCMICIIYLYNIRQWRIIF